MSRSLTLAQLEARRSKLTAVAFRRDDHGGGNLANRAWLAVERVDREIQRRRAAESVETSEVKRLGYSLPLVRRVAESLVNTDRSEPNAIVDVVLRARLDRYGAGGAIRRLATGLELEDEMELAVGMLRIARKLEGRP